MTYHFNLRMTRRLSNFQTANAEEHALFNMSRIQQTVVLDLRTSTILISVLPTIDQSLRKTCHFEGYLREYKMTQNTLYRRKLKMANAPWCSSSRIRCIQKAHFAFHTCFGNFCGQNGKIRRQGRQKYNERKSKQRQYTGKYFSFQGSGFIRKGLPLSNSLCCSFAQAVVPCRFSVGLTKSSRTAAC